MTERFINHPDILFQQSTEIKTIATIPIERKMNHLASNRPLSEYEHCLNFNRQLLEGMTILNVGSGHSNLQQECKSLVDVTILNIDIDIGSMEGLGVLKKISPLNFKPLKESLQKREEGLINHLNDLEAANLLEDIRLILAKSLQLKQKRVPQLIQADVVSLPLPDQSVDVTLALQSIYQIPTATERLTAYREMMRVSKTAVHVGAVYGNDWKLLKQLAKQCDYTIVYSKPLFQKNTSNTRVGSDKITSTIDYKRLLTRLNRDNLMVEFPQKNKPKTTKLFNKIISARTDDGSGSTVILARNSL